MIGRDEIAVNAVDCHLRTSIDALNLRRVTDVRQRIQVRFRFAV